MSAAQTTHDAYLQVQDLVARYERIRRGGVDPREDNALAITTDGRKLALDNLTVKKPDGGVLLEGQPAEQNVWMSHGDQVSAPPEGFEVLASTSATNRIASAFDG